MAHRGKKDVFKAKLKGAAARLLENQQQIDPSRPDATALPDAVSPSSPAQPLFYEDPQPLHSSLHGDKALKRSADYRFAAKAHAVILHAQEFRTAATNYPIVFAGDDAAMPLALLGYRDSENLCVDQKGKWKPGAYVPAYVRRYPFAIGPGTRESEEILYLDVGSDLIVSTDSDVQADPLFVNGKPSGCTQKALEFCVAFQQQIPETTAFVEALKTEELLVQRDVQLNLPSGESCTLTGFQLIATEKFDKLKDEIYLKWRQRGWIALVYWHWASLDNFARMATLTAVQRAHAPELSTNGRADEKG